MLGARFGALCFGTCNVKTLRRLRLYVAGGAGRSKRRVWDMCLEMVYPIAAQKVEVFSSPPSSPPSPLWTLAAICALACDMFTLEA